MRMSILIAQQVLREALHNRVIWVYTLILLSGLGLCEYISSVALIEAREFQMSIYSTLMRWSAVLVLIQFSVSSVSREWNEKGLDYVLAMPLSRGHYVIGKALGLAWLAGIFVALALLAFSLYQFNISTLAWLTSLFLELLIVASLALFVAISLQNSAVAAAVVIAFYVLCRALASIELLASQPLVQSKETAQVFIENFVSGLSQLFPALYQFADSQWLLYAQLDTAMLLSNFIQCVVYCGLLLSAAMFDLYRKSL